jgi:hypothetical protein
MATTPGKWRKIEEIYHEALELEIAARTPFLDRACGSDAELRAEVDSLLAQPDSTREALKQPAFHFAAGSAPLMPGASRHPTRASTTASNARPARWRL